MVKRAPVSPIVSVAAPISKIEDLEPNSAPKVWSRPPVEKLPPPTRASAEEFGAALAEPANNAPPGRTMVAP